MVFVIKSTTQKRIAQDLRKEICDKNHTVRLSKIWAIKIAVPHSSWGCIFYWERLSFSLLNSWANHSGIQYDIAHIASSISCPLFSGLFLPHPTKIWRFFPGGEPLFSVATEQQSESDNMNVSSKFVICLNLVSASTLLLLLSTRFEWFWDVMSRHGGFPFNHVRAQRAYL